MDRMKFGAVRHAVSSLNLPTKLLIPVSSNQGENVGPSSPNGADAAAGASKHAFPKQPTTTSPRTLLNGSTTAPLRPAVGVLGVARQSAAQFTPPRDSSPRGSGRWHNEATDKPGGTNFRVQKRKVGALLEQDPRQQRENKNRSREDEAPSNVPAAPQKRACLQASSHSSPLAHIAAVAQQRSRSSSESSTDSTTATSEICSSDAAMTPQQRQHQQLQRHHHILALAQMQQNPALAYHQHRLLQNPSGSQATTYTCNPFTPAARGPEATTLPVATTSSTNQSGRWTATNVQTVPQPQSQMTKFPLKKKVRKPKRESTPTSLSSLSSVTGSVDTPTSGTDSSIPKKCGRWTDEEHKVFVRGLRKHGKNWSVISQMVRTRTTVQVRTHAQKYFIKQQRAGLDPMEGVGTTVDALEEGRSQPGTEAPRASVAKPNKNSVSEKKNRKKIQRRPRTGSSSCNGTEQHLQPRFQVNSLQLAQQQQPPPQQQQQQFFGQPRMTAVRPPTVLSAAVPMGQYRPHSFAAMGFPARLPSVLLNRPQSPASTRTIQRAAAHLVNLYDLGGGRNSGICEAVY